MCMVLLAQAHGLLQNRMGQTPLDLDHDGLVVLVAHHNTFKDAFRHHASPLLRRALGALLLRRLDPRDIAADLTYARGVLDLPRSFLEAPVELRRLHLDRLVLGLVRAHGCHITGFHGALLRHSPSRATKRVLIGSFAAASASASSSI